MRRTLLFLVTIALQLSSTVFAATSGSGSLPGVESKIPKPTPVDKEKQQALEKKKKKAEQLIRNKLQNRIRQLEGKESPNSSFSDFREGNEYPYPGVVMFRDGRWDGSDNIYKISDHISIGVDLDIPPGSPEEPPFPIQKEAIRTRVKAIFQSAGITPYSQVSIDQQSVSPVDTFGFQNGELKPPLPLFMIVIIAQPISKGYAFYCAANLFEDVDVKRIRLNEGVWQAITWERQHLVVSSTEEISYHLGRCIDDLAYSFIKVYRYFENVRPSR